MKLLKYAAVLIISLLLISYFYYKVAEPVDKNRRKIVRRYPSGRIHQIGYQKKNSQGKFVKDGEWKIWYKNGQIASKSFYKNGEFSGNYYMWYEDGQKACEDIVDPNVKGKSKYTRWHNPKSRMVAPYRQGQKKYEYTTHTWR